MYDNKNKEVIGIVLNFYIFVGEIVGEIFILWKQLQKYVYTIFG